MGVRPGLEQLHSFPEGRPSTKSAHFWCKESGGVRSTEHPGPIWVKEESPWGSRLMEGRCSTPKESPCPQGPGSVARVPPYTHGQQPGPTKGRLGPPPVFQGRREDEMTQQRESGTPATAGAQTVAAVITRWERGNGHPGARPAPILTGQPHLCPLLPVPATSDRRARVLSGRWAGEQLPLSMGDPCAPPHLNLPPTSPTPA